MAEATAAVAALSLAANIIQVTDAGRNFIAAAWKIWRSGRDGREAVEGFDTLRIMSRNLKDVVEQVHVQTMPPTAIDVASDKGIFHVAADCELAAQDILDSFEQIGLSSKGKRRDAIISAFKLAWKKDDITAMEARFDRVRDQLTFNLVASMRVYAMQSIGLQETILSEMRASQAGSNEDSVSDDDRTGLPFGSSIVTLLHPQGQGSQPEQEELDGFLLDCVHRLEQDVGPIEDVDDSTFDMTPRRKETIRSKILSMLHYDGMEDRENTVEEAHKSTFRWIFDQSEEREDRPWDPFPDWLESDQQLYWITGKAGSGKSTLMKYVTEQDGNSTIQQKGGRCSKHLKAWSNHRPLVVASFYFWASGTKMQTSKTGLYSTLLYRILEGCPEAMPKVFPEIWASLCVFNSAMMPLTEETLRQRLLRLVRILNPTTNICLFVDGLDEFNGDHSDLIELFNTIIGCTSAKKYVKSRLEPSEAFTLLLNQEREFAFGLIDNVVRKASGVFLWVKLVVSSLLDGMKHGDRVVDLQRRLDRLPPDLENLYDRILGSLDPFYFEHACQYFCLMEACEEAPAAIMLSLADEEDAKFPLQEFGTQWNDPIFLANRVETMRRRLNSRCRGLIEISRESHPRVGAFPGTPEEVQYLHRTVKDYASRPDVRHRLVQGLKGPFDAHLRLCAANLAAMRITRLAGPLEKTCRDTGTVEMLELYKYVLDGLDATEMTILTLKNSSRVRPENVPLMLMYMDTFRQGYMKEIGQGSILAIFRLNAYSLTERIQRFEMENNSFLSVAVAVGAVEYVKARAPAECVVKDSGAAGSEEKTRRLRRMLRYCGRLVSRGDSDQGDDHGAWPLLADALPRQSLCPPSKRSRSEFRICPQPGPVFHGWPPSLRHSMESYPGLPCRNVPGYIIGTGPQGSSP